MQRLKEGWFSAIRRRLAAMCVVLLGAATVAMAQNKVTISGKVVDESGEPLPGVSVAVSGTTVGTVTDFDGNYSLSVPVGAQISYSFIGFDDKNVAVAAGQNVYNITMSDSSKALDEVVVVGYGQQKKESIVGAITQATGEVLERAAGITNVGQALTGNLPGVVTVASNGMPGEEQPQIFIRGSQNQPLVLVDGVERDMASVDMASVETLSVLKDASATAVFGVKGANGVILITTKRGREGRAQVNVQANAIMKMVAKLPNKLDSYDALVQRNRVIEHELNIADSWGAYRPMSFIENYRNQGDKKDELGNLLRERYPNVDWQDALFKKHAMSYNANVNVAGGSQFVKYFAALDYVNEGDMFKEFDNSRGYKSGYSFNRIGARSNLDFNLTKSTVLKVGIAGSMGIRRCPATNDGDEWQMAQRWAGAYSISPDAFLPKYSDGTWGWLPSGTNVSNSIENLAVAGTQQKITTTITTDFSLDQDLSFLLEGLNVRGTISWDNRFLEAGRGVNDLNNSTVRNWCDPETGQWNMKQPYVDYQNFNTQEPLPKWSVSNGSVQDWNTYRRFNYQIQLNYNHKFADKHSVGLMGVFQRDEFAQGNMIPSYRENWVFRATYDFLSKYFLEYNGAYNGSEKYSKDNRFVFFSSGALGWTISEESFMQNLKEKGIIDMLKIRGSIGQIGDDSKGDRFAYLSQWEISGNKLPGMSDQEPDGQSSYDVYREKTIGNPDLKWETVTKMNVGVDYAFLGGLLAGNVEFFKDKRKDMVMTEVTPKYFGQAARSINYGEMTTKGYEIELRVSKTLPNEMRLWGNFNMTHAENVMDKVAEPQLYASYRKKQGYASGQTTSFIDCGFINTFDEIYGSTEISGVDNQKLVGDYHIMDFDGNGIIDDNDTAPYGYSSTPENTYNATVGVDWKGWNFFVQFYGVSNVTRDVTLQSWGSSDKLNTVYDMGSWWIDNQGSSDYVTPRYNSKPDKYYHCTQFLEDASFVRLKNVELGYTFDKNFNFMKKIHFTYMKLFVSGNNLFVWSNLPDDRESNFGGSTGQGTYPTVKRINFGLKFSL
ncbi:MAG: TonB-dependent receptor [Bacteroidia bacterium]|nr:TonB-dependent receptor [Bacteroidia bacterium]